MPDIDGSPVLVVLAVGSWQFGGGIMPGQKQVGQVTKIDVGGVMCYVRENLDGRQSFLISSGQRWAEKGGNRADRRPMQERQILDLCAPAAVWDQVASLVHHTDAHRRPVRRYRCFTSQWAKRALASKLFTSQISIDDRTADAVAAGRRSPSSSRSSGGD